MKFTDSHEWIDVVDGIATVGITSFASSQLGDVVYLKLPRVGETLLSGGEAAIVESTKAATDIYSPASGEVVAVNEQLLELPSLLSHDPEKGGWLFKLRVQKPEELHNLLQREDYLERIT